MGCLHYDEKKEEVSLQLPSLDLPFLLFFANLMFSLFRKNNFHQSNSANLKSINSFFECQGM
jgi:hypothetical protein